jgi:tripartite ATP-independent transporter DctM subunit
MTDESRAPAGGDGLRRAVSRALDGLDRVTGLLAVFFLVVIVVDVAAGVVSRYVFNNSFSWTEEVGRWAFTYLIFLGVALAHRKRDHIAVGIAHALAPPRFHAAIDFAIDVVVIYTTFYLLFASQDLMSLVGGMNVMLQLPNWTKFAVIPASCVVALAYLALRPLEEGRGVAYAAAGIALGAGLYALTASGVIAPPRGSPSVYMGVAFAATLLLGVPIAFAMLFSAFIANLGGDLRPPPAVVQNLANGAARFLLLAIPLFMAAAHLMNIGGLSNRLIDFARELVGNARGGLAQVNVLTSVMFGGISGSSGADAALDSKLIVPQMVRSGYSPAFSCAITASSAVLPNIIPPSIAMLVFASIAEVSVIKLFISGILPGLILAALFMGTVYVISRRRGYGRTGVPASAAGIARGFLRAAPVLALAALIVGGIRFGIFTPTEAGAAAVVYALLLGLVAYRAYGPVTLYRQAIEMAREAAGIGFLIGVAAPMAYVLIAERMPQALVGAAVSWVSSPEAILLAVVALGTVSGMFIDLTAGMLIIVPLIFPLIVQVGIDPVHFGLVLVVTLMMGGITPPVGILVFIPAAVTGTPVGAIFREAMPFIATMFAAIILFALVPDVSLVLVRWWG